MVGITTTATLPSGSASTGKRSQRNVKTLPLIAPSVIVLILWMIVPLAMTLWFSFQYYNLLDPSVGGLRRASRTTPSSSPTRPSGRPWPIRSSWCSGSW